MNLQVVDRALDLASRWQQVANRKISEFENSFHKKMGKLLNHPVDKVFLIELMDQSFRSGNASRIKDQIDYLFSKYGMAAFFTNSERFLIFIFRHVGTLLPQISVPLFVESIRADTKKVVLSAEDKALNKHLKNRRNANTRVNLNQIGELVLGEAEARRRVNQYMKALENPNIDYISIKISTIDSQIHPFAFEQTVGDIVPRLQKIFLHAKNHPFVNPKGVKEHKFVNLDMEEYRDLSITVEAFQRALETPELKDYRAGIVLQAYLPDALQWQKSITRWAKERVARGGAPIQLRLVKGANLEMEKTEASQKGWEIVTHTEKIDTDSNYKLMVEYGLQPENARVVHIGVASHNLFELAYALEVAKHNHVLECFSLEMLEGMGEASRIAIFEVSGQGVTLYAPIAYREQFTHAIAYLVRRLDENTGEDHFIRYSFDLKVGSPQWNKLKEQFIESFGNRRNLFVGPKRKQNRLEESWESKDSGGLNCEFKNEPDTDFILESNRRWAHQIREKWKKNPEEELTTVPFIVGGRSRTEDREIVKQMDQSQKNVFCGQYARATAHDLQEAVRVAKEDPDCWQKLSTEDRCRILSRVASQVRKQRGDLIGVAAAEVGKVFTETDVEVSEAVDFLEFYSHSARYFENWKNLKFRGKGVGLVVPPWNFPIAIPVGGIAACLASGNRVILKPSSRAVLCAYEICRCFWMGGVSQNVLQFVPCPGDLAQEHLVKDRGIDFVILTGGESTARKMLESRADLFLTAETGGKNATIVTALADREQAIKNVIHSAFSNSGQKCSATSLLVLEDEVYFDQKFRETLVDAACSLKVGSVWNFENKIGTLAGPVDGALKHAIENLEQGESWALKPSYANGNPFMLGPAIKWGVREGSFCHKTELFGPVLSVIRADNLEHAVNIVNQTGYGLTSGIESLDERELDYWKQNIVAGNLYINRGTTGAIVLRQPFGGFGKSAVGMGRKVGTFNYITQFMNVEEIGKPTVWEAKTGKLVKLLERMDTESRHFGLKEDIQKLRIALQSYLFCLENEFLKDRDFCQVRGEDNVFRYQKLGSVAIRICKGDGFFDSVARILAARVCGVKIHVSLEPDDVASISQYLFRYSKKILAEQDSVKTESEASFAEGFAFVDRIFYAKSEKVSEFIYKQAAKHLKFVVCQPPLMEGRLELLNFFEEQSISHSYHRYGNPGRRALVDEKL